MKPITDKLIITFPTTVAALAMEAACVEDGTPGRLIPVPTAISAGCGMCWAAELSDEGVCLATIENHALVFEGIHRL